MPQSLKVVVYLSLCALAMLGGTVSHAQKINLSGRVLEPNGAPIPFANIDLLPGDQESNADLSHLGTSAGIDGTFYLDLTPGLYRLAISSVGYDTRVVPIVVESDLTVNIELEPKQTEIAGLTITVGGRDPAYAIMDSLRQHRNEYDQPYYPASQRFYLRASEESKETAKAREKRLKRRKTSDTIAVDSNTATPSMNMVEVVGRRYIGNHGQHKEFREGFDKRGDATGLYYLSTSTEDFNFYQNLLYLETLAETPFLSPVSPTAPLAYKFRLVAIDTTAEGLIWHIGISPKFGGNAWVEGHLAVKDSTWHIAALDLMLNPDLVIAYDQFAIRQEFDWVEEKPLLVRQELRYMTKAGKRRFYGRTVAHFTDWQKEDSLPKKFFGNEVSVTEQEAYERDTTYWDSLRLEPLSLEEAQFIRYSDSIKAWHESDEYLDSIDSMFNKITFMKLAVLGWGLYDRESKRVLYFGPAISMVNPFGIGGTRVGFYTGFSKWGERRRRLSINARPNYGIRNEDLKGSIRASYFYNPFKQGRVGVGLSREFELVNPYDSYLNLFRPQNFFEQDRWSAYHVSELVNGLYASISVEFAVRRDIVEYDLGVILDSLFVNEAPLAFPTHQSFYTEIELSYTPGQRYMREPNRKVVLGSRFPTFSLQHRRGWKGLAGSSTNFDYLEGSISQSFEPGTFGRSFYKIAGGAFLNQDSVPLIDYKYQRAGDPFIFTHPLETFQQLPRTFPTFNLYLEGHYLHRFNGLLISKIPFLRELKIRSVAGIGVLYVPENSTRYGEVYAGIERIFPIFRERMRLGFYVVGSESNLAAPMTGWKISIEFYDREAQRWNF